MIGDLVANVNLKPGDCIRVRGELGTDPRSITLNLGKDNNNLCLHFNPRFKLYDDVRIIVCNSKRAGVWETEQRESTFPFHAGTVVEVSITFNLADMTIKLPDGYTFKFPNRLNLDTISYMGIHGDFKVKSVTFE